MPFGVALPNLADFLQIAGTFRIVPEHVAEGHVVPVPGLEVQIVVDELGGVRVDVAGHGVPLESHVLNPVLADDVQIVLILGNLEGDALQQAEEHVQKIALPHGVQIHQQYAGVEVVIRRHPQALFRVQRQRRDGADHAVGDRAHQILLQIHVVQL